MAICKSCNLQMQKDYKLKVEGRLYGIDVCKGNPNKISGEKLPISVSICPQCGEISLHTEMSSDKN